MASEQNKIWKEFPHLILCEGADAYYFMIWLLDDIKTQEKEFSVFRVYNFKGINELKSFLASLIKLEGFEDVVKSLTIIRDAETNAEGACQSIKDTLASLKFAVPNSPCAPGKDQAVFYKDIVTGFLLFPSCSNSLENGTLEDLCVRILADDHSTEILKDVELSLDKYKNILPRHHKNRLHMYFSFTDNYVSYKIGEAAKAKAFSYKKNEILSLKNFLKQMLKESE